MAAIETNSNGRGHSKYRLAVPRIDMTPMVDLGFLLIAFFIFTTSLTAKTAMSLNMPKPLKDSLAIAAGKAMTILLGENNKVLVYEGQWTEARKANRILISSYNEEKGIGNLIREKKASLRQSGKKPGDQELVVLIKPTREASYKNLIDALDEMQINGVSSYAVTDPTAEETKYSNSKQ